MLLTIVFDVFMLFEIYLLLDILAILFLTLCVVHGINELIAVFIWNFQCLHKKKLCTLYINMYKKNLHFFL